MCVCVCVCVCVFPSVQQLQHLKTATEFLMLCYEIRVCGSLPYEQGQEKITLL